RGPAETDGSGLGRAGKTGHDDRNANASIEPLPRRVLVYASPDVIASKRSMNTRRPAGLAKNLKEISIRLPGAGPGYLHRLSHAGP
ncbi:MAG TPA: hypothetical protein VIS99_01245, partial [Terrimicrobiaceae bacterium]